MIRATIIPVNTELHISLPKDYVGKQVELLLYTTDETSQLPIEAEVTDLLAYNKEVDNAMARMNNGEFIAHEDLEKEMESW